VERQLPCELRLPDPIAFPFVKGEWKLPVPCIVRKVRGRDEANDYIVGLRKIPSVAKILRFAYVRIYHL
jgi:hypothetical protein